MVGTSIDGKSNRGNKSFEMGAIVATVVTLLGAAEGLQTMFNATVSASQQRVAAVFTLHEQRLQEDQLVQHLQKVNDAIWEVREVVPHYQSGAEDFHTKQAQLTKFYDRSIAVGKAKRTDILFALDFYRGVANCVAQNICEKEAAETLFKDDIRDFTVTFAPFLCKLREELGDQTIAKELEDFYQPKKSICDF